MQVTTGQPTDQRGGGCHGFVVVYGAQRVGETERLPPKMNLSCPPHLYLSQFSMTCIASAHGVLAQSRRLTCMARDRLSLFCKALMQCSHNIRSILSIHVAATKLTLPLQNCNLFVVNQRIQDCQEESDHIQLPVL